VCYTVIKSITSTSVYRAAAWPWRRIFAVIFLRTSRETKYTDARRDRQPTTGESIRHACRERKLKLRSHEVCCNQWPSATLHEIETSSHLQETVFLYFHGGGYRNPLEEAGHMPVVLECAKALDAGRTFLLEYGLVPELQYPGQLVQAACALNLLLIQLGCQPNQMVIGGDSAGGNLALALLAHIKQPHPLVPNVEQVSIDDGKLKGALLISPWVSNALTAASYEENSKRDFLNRKAMETFIRLWAPKDEIWANLQAPTDFWVGLPVKRVLLTVGGFEVFRDDVRTLATLMDAKGNKDSLIRFVETPAEIHAQPVVDAALRLPLCKSLLEILLWCRSLP
jgi:acetyl esterase/lipase